MKCLVNKNAQMGTGYHKIHKIGCKKMPKKENIIELDECMCLLEAKSRANEYYAHVSGCKYCCREIFYKNKMGL